MQRWKVVTALMTIGLIVLGAPQPAAALESGDTVIFLIPLDSNQPDPPSGAHEFLVFRGGPTTTIDVTGCGSGTHPVQDATLVDEGGAGRSGPVEGVIVKTEDEPVPPGTRLTSITFIGACSIGATAYLEYRGTVV